MFIYCKEYQMPSSKLKKVKGTAKRNSRKTKTTKTAKKTRPSPNESATSLPEGSIRRGGNGSQWVIKRASNGTPRWVPIESVELNGWRLLTVDHLAKNIGKQIEIYDTGYDNEFPKKNAKMFKWHFTPNGDIEINRKKTIIGWLKTRNPAIQRGQFVFVLGSGDMEAVQIDSVHTNIASTNVMNTMSFVKC
jgi:hypothetical protein